MTQELIGAGAQRDSRVPMPGPVLTRESQLKLDYYERFGQLLQEQLDTVVARAACGLGAPASAGAQQAQERQVFLEVTDRLDRR
jgi:hypothetical protein